MGSVWLLSQSQQQSKVLSVYWWPAYRVCILDTPGNQLPMEKSKSKSLSLDRLFATPWTIEYMEFYRPEYWSGQPFPSPGDLPNPRIEPRSPALQADSLPAEPPGKPSYQWKVRGKGRSSYHQFIPYPQSALEETGSSHLLSRDAPRPLGQLIIQLSSVNRRSLNKC